MKPLAFLTKDRAALVGAVLVGLLLLFAVAGPALTEGDPFASDFVHGASPDHLPVAPNEPSASASAATGRGSKIGSRPASSRGEPPAPTARRPAYTPSSMGNAGETASPARTR